MVRPAWLAILLALAAPAAAQDTRQAAPGAAPPKATIADAAWIVGTWRGAGIDGAPAMESYSAPAGGRISAHFEQLDRKGALMFYELMQIAEQNGSLVYRLKHFGPDLKGWEEKDEVKAFALVAVAPDALHFDGLSFYRKGANGLRAVVRVDEKDGGTHELAFDYSRAAR